MIKLAFPQIVFTSYAWEKFWAYINIADGEIGGLGEIKITPDIITVRDLLLFEQTATEKEFRLNPQSLSKITREAMASGKAIDSMRLFWHSHAKYSVGWSEDKDEVTIRTLSQKVYLLSIVGNKDSEYLTRYDVQLPFPQTLHGLPIEVVSVSEQPDYAELKREVFQKVKFSRTEGS